jgi:hypothetical protein
MALADHSTQHHMGRDTLEHILDTCQVDAISLPLETYLQRPQDKLASSQNFLICNN